VSLRFLMKSAILFKLFRGHQPLRSLTFTVLRNPRCTFSTSADNRFRPKIGNTFCSQVPVVPVRQTSTMPPVTGGVSGRIDDYITKNNVFIFSKTTCPFCAEVKNLFKSLGVEVQVLELDNDPEGAEVQAALAEKTGQRTVPNIFINGEHVGGASDVKKLHAEEQLMAKVNAKKGHNYEYDIVVIGGGSGGLSASKEAARLGLKVAVCDFVKPTPKGATWGLGGTCVNVGCIPKKLMHQAAILGDNLKDANEYGWGTDPTNTKHDWQKMVQGIQDHIGGLNWGYRVALREKAVTYLNEYAEFVDPHTLRTVNKKGKERTVTSDKFIIATGGRPRYPGIPGDKEHGITSDDIFSLPHAPGKTLLVGASYIALECAGFLKGLGYDVTVMVRSILLRGFDRQCADNIGNYMEAHGINFIRECVPTSIEEVEPGTPAKLKVSAKYTDGTDYTDEFNTVVFAIGRDACTSNIGLDKVGVKLNPKNGKIIHDAAEKSNIDHVFAIGDVLDDKPELTPVAIQAGKNLAKRLAGVSSALTDYVNVCTTVFTPLEYGTCGLSEDDAIKQYGEADIEVYHANFQPLEWTVSHRENSACYCKLVCVKSQAEKVVGFHYLGPNAGEVTQGFGMAIKMGATKAHFDDLIGIHPTTAENFTTMEITKSSGNDPTLTGC